MFGTVERGKKITRFRLEYTLRNGCQIYEIIQVPNNQLERWPATYKHVWDKMLEDLEARVKKHIG